MPPQRLQYSSWGPPRHSLVLPSHRVSASGVSHGEDTPRAPSAQQQAGDGGVGDQPCAAPCFVLQGGSPELQHSELVGPEKPEQERSQGPQHHPALRARFPCMIYPGTQGSAELGSETGEEKMATPPCPFPNSITTLGDNAARNQDRGVTSPPTSHTSQPASSPSSSIPSCPSEQASLLQLPSNTN